MSKFIERRQQTNPAPPTPKNGAGNTYIDFQVDAGVKNGIAVVSYDNGAPSLEFSKRQSGFGRVQYAVSVPSNYIDGYGINLTIYWSAADASIGNVHWQLGYTSLKSGTTLVNTPLTLIDYAQQTSGVAGLLKDTGQNLSLSVSGISANDLILLNVLRLYDITDTYSSTARIHLVRLTYNISA